MTIPVSTVPAAKAALVAGITAQVADLAVLVSYDEASNEPDDVITVGKAKRSVESFALVGGFGAGAFNEVYSIDIEISCMRLGDDPQGTNERAYLLLAAVETWIRTNPTLSGTVNVAVPADSTDDDAYSDVRKGRRVAITLPVACQAVI